MAQGANLSVQLLHFYLRERKIANILLSAFDFMRTGPEGEPDLKYIEEKATGAIDTVSRHQSFSLLKGTSAKIAYNETDNLKRGGSDYTAALLAEALHATRVDIWTDVPGIYTTDPRVVPAAKRIDEIAFEEAAEMATFGAKVLHPATLLPAVRSDIPVFVGSSKDPKAGGTLVCNKTQNPPLFRALALRRKQTLLTLHSLNMLHSRGFLSGSVRHSGTS